VGRQTSLRHFIAAGDFSSERKKHSRRSNTVDISIVASLQELINQDLGRFMRSLARELGISEASVRNKMAEDTR
jgi:predicted transcriptional regulator